MFRVPCSVNSSVETHRRCVSQAKGYVNITRIPNQYVCPFTHQLKSVSEAKIC